MKLAKSNASNTEWSHNLVGIYDRIGDVQRSQGDLNAALQSYRSATEIGNKLMALDVENAQWQADLAYCHWEIAYLLRILPKQSSKSFLMSVRTFCARR